MRTATCKEDSFFFFLSFLIHDKYFVLGCLLALFELFLGSFLSMLARNTGSMGFMTQVLIFFPFIAVIFSFPFRFPPSFLLWVVVAGFHVTQTWGLKFAFVAEAGLELAILLHGEACRNAGPIGVQMLFYE